MPTCQNCDQDWSWQQTFKKSFTLDTGMECPHCGKKQYLTYKSKKRNGLGIFIIPLTMLFSLVFNISPFITLSVLLGTALLMMGIYPFFVELSSQEKHLF